MRQFLVELWWICEEKCNSYKSLEYGPINTHSFEERPNNLYCPSSGLSQPCIASALWSSQPPDALSRLSGVLFWLESRQMVHFFKHYLCPPSLWFWEFSEQNRSELRWGRRAPEGSLVSGRRWQTVIGGARGARSCSTTFLTDLFLIIWSRSKKKMSTLVRPHTYSYIFSCYIAFWTV